MLKANQSEYIRPSLSCQQQKSKQKIYLRPDVIAEVYNANTWMAEAQELH